MKKNKFSIEMKVGIFILAAVCALILFVFIQAKGGKYRGYDISVSFDYVAGLEIGSPVRVSGVRVGEVKIIEIIYNTAPKVFVRMKIRQDVKIPKYSRITIQTLGIIGEKYIEIAPSKEKESLLPGETIQGENPLSLERVADAGESIIIRLNDILGDVRGITGDEKLQENVKRVIKGAASAVENIDSAFVKINQLSTEVAETNKKLQDVIVAQGPKLEMLIDNTNSFVVSGKEKMELTLDDIRALAAEGKKSSDMFSKVAETSVAFKSVASDMQSLIGKTSSEITTTSASINEFFRKIQSEGLIARLMKEEELVDHLETEILLLQDATKEFKTASEGISTFSFELNKLISNINAGEGSVGKFLSSDELYQEVMDFIKDIKEHPWKLFIKKRN